MHGRATQLERLYFHCLLNPDQASNWSTPIKKGLAEKKTLFAAFKLGPLSYRSFVFSKGKRQGEEGFVLEAPLMTFYWINCSGARVYTQPSELTPTPDADFKENAPVVVRREQSTFAALI